MSIEFADNVWTIFYCCLYIFGVIPAIGHKLGTSPKAHWSGYDYEPCMGRGVMAHAVVGVSVLILWAVFVKVFN